MLGIFRTKATSTATDTSTPLRGRTSVQGSPSASSRSSSCESFVIVYNEDNDIVHVHVPSRTASRSPSPCLPPAPEQSSTSASRSPSPSVPPAPEQSSTVVLRGSRPTAKQPENQPPALQSLTRAQREELLEQFPEIAKQGKELGGYSDKTAIALLLTAKCDGPRALAAKVALTERVADTGRKVLANGYHCGRTWNYKFLELLMDSGDAALEEAVRPFLLKVVPNFADYVAQYGTGVPCSELLKMVGAKDERLAQTARSALLGCIGSLVKKVADGGKQTSYYSALIELSGCADANLSQAADKAVQSLHGRR